MIRRNPVRRSRSGAAVIEFAVVAPVLFAVIMGIIEFGRFFMVAGVVVNASREGARFAVAQGGDADTVAATQANVRDYLMYAGIGTGSGDSTTTPVVQVSTGDTSSPVNWTAQTTGTTKLSSFTSGRPVKCDVEVAFSRVSWVPSGMFISGSARVKGSTVMRRE